MNINEPKRIYRYPERGVIAGICHGLGVYLNIDPVVARLIFVLLALSGGAGFFLYFIMWLIVPVMVEQKTSEKKSESAASEDK